MPKERGFNPAQAQRKADKKAEIAKSKRQQQTQRNEKLARRNPERVQRKIDELNQVKARQNGVLRPKDQETLAQLEKEIKGISKAREVLGDAAPKFRQERQGEDVRREQEERRRTHLGKRRRGESEVVSESDGGSETEDDARDIPMPRDTPPPVPRKEYKRHEDGQSGPRVPHTLPPKPGSTSTTSADGVPRNVWSAAPQLRDLKKEAIKLVPTAVAQKKKLAAGQGRLLEAEEMDRLEKAGYYDGVQEQIGARDSQALGTADKIDDEVRRFQAEMGSMLSDASRPHRTVEVEDVEDDGD